jgi:predicted lipoprotein with Yx(FWY)xxD motif
MTDRREWIMTARIVAALMSTALVAAACSSSGSPHSKGTNSAGSSGGAVAITVSSGHLVGPDGKTLYFNTVDTATKIQCTGSCASLWPPLDGTPKPGSGLDATRFGTIKRPDGGMQVAYDGHPLYEFASDSPGGMGGAGLTDSGGKWVVATVGIAAVSPSPSMSERSPGSSSDDMSRSSSDDTSDDSSGDSSGGGYGGY